MVSGYMCSPSFRPGDQVVSLVIHPPEIQSGTKATIISPYVCGLYAVQLPDGQLHRWFAGTELERINPDPMGQLNCCGTFSMGEYVRVLNDQGHPPMIHKGMIVKVVKVLPQVPFYDLRLENGKYHRWLADFEIIHANLI